MSECVSRPSGGNGGAASSQNFAPAAEQPITVEIKMADGIFIKSMRVQKAGTFVPQHSHTYDHVSMLAAGAVRVWQDGDLMGEFVAPKGITIKAGVKHLFETLEDGTLIYCIHNVARTGDVEIEEEHQIVGNA